MSSEEFTVEIQETKALIELELSKFVRSLDHTLSSQVEYALLSQGKRLRPLVLLLAAQSVGGDRTKAVPLALALELTHASSLVHDDIIDKDVFRRGKLALHSHWSTNVAILTSDLIIAFAVYLASAYGETIIRIISRSAIELCQGEHLDLTLELGSQEKEYFQMVELKSAALFKAAARCGALVGGASSEESEALSSFGKNFGIAYQLRDDLLDVDPGEGQVSNDLKNGRIALPIIHLYGMSNSTEKAAISEALRVARKKTKIMSDLAIQTILRRLEETGSIAYVEKKLDEYSNLALESLAPIKNSPYKLSLVQIMKSLKRSHA